MARRLLLLVAPCCVGMGRFQRCATRCGNVARTLRVALTEQWFGPCSGGFDPWLYNSRTRDIASWGKGSRHQDQGAGQRCVLARLMQLIWRATWVIYTWAMQRLAPFPRPDICSIGPRALPRSRDLDSTQTLGAAAVICGRALGPVGGLRQSPQPLDQAGGVPARAAQGLHILVELIDQSGDW